jgi:hypothetical protein
MSGASASSSTSDAPRSVSVRGLTGAAGPLHLAAEAHSPVEPIPSRARHSLPADRPAGRSDSPELSGPFDDITRPSPVGGGTSPPPRFRSQVFATSQRFPSRAELRGLVSCRSRPWDSSPSERSPRPGSRTPLEAASSLAVIHRRPATYHPPPFAAGFPDARVARRGGLVPPATMGSLSARRAGALPGRPGPRAAGPSRPARFTRFEALLPLRVRSHRSGLPRAGGRCSPGLLPL